MIPDYRLFKNRDVLVHSAKGSTWDKHKYVKVIDGVYYYPEGYSKGRTISDIKSSKARKKKAAERRLERFENLKKKLTAKGEAYEPKKGDKDYESYSSMDKERFKEYYESYYGSGKLTDKQLNRVLKAAQRKEKADEKKANEKKSSTSSKSIETLAKEVINGKYGNGEQRKKLLGSDYNKIQKRVNELVKASKTSSPPSKKSSNDTSKTSSKSSKNATTKKKKAKKTKTSSSAVTTMASKGLDLAKVFSMYKKK